MDVENTPTMVANILIIVKGIASSILDGRGGPEAPKRGTNQK